MRLHVGFVLAAFPLAAACTDDCLKGDCPSGEICLDGDCTAAAEVSCEEDVDCNDDLTSKLAYRCQGGKCALSNGLTPIPDAGERSLRDGGQSNLATQDGAVLTAFDAGFRVDSGDDCPIASDMTVMGRLVVTADDDRRVWINGVQVDDFGFPDRTYSVAKVVDVPIYIHPQHINVIAIEGKNIQRTSGLDRGVLFDLRFPSMFGTEVRVVSNAQVVFGPDPVAPGFTGSTFDDSSWLPAVEEAAYPSRPWNQITGFENSNAFWIWSYRAGAAAAEKTTMETVLFRRTFYVMPDGELSEFARRCSVVTFPDAGSYLDASPSDAGAPD